MLSDNERYQKLLPIFNFLPNKCPNVYVAGGAAVDYDKASDVDLWFPKEGWQAAKDFLTQFKITQTRKIFKYDDYDSAKEKGTTYGNKDNLVLGEVYFGDAIKKLVQIIVTDKPTSLDLLNLFDISTHAIAVHADGKVVKCEKFTDPSQPPRILVYRSNTLSRYIKICNRYNHIPNIKYLTHLMNFSH